ncbi:GTPase IMAP family member 7-like isoform X2 [Genypterus blacodes]|uniref:GTPase IMAP family member 7-like isoform X2 n=1 Tax=Genypterus blacodes TaxID=154954 RepID=UPI003F75D1DC
MADTRRIVLLGKTGFGKSYLADTIFGETVFQIGDSPNSETKKCQAKTRSINGRSITLIDTPGFFDTHKNEMELKPEIVRCITKCAPGPHTFLIVLKVDRYTTQEMEVIAKVKEYFSEEALKYAVVVFTYGDQLSPGKKIEAFVRESEGLSDLVRRCGGRCHVIDNKYWNNNQQDGYRSNRFQVTELLKTIEKIVTGNNGGCYTNEVLQEAEREIQEQEMLIRQTSAILSTAEIRETAIDTVFERLSRRWIGITAGVLLTVFLGVGVAAITSYLGPGAVALGVAAVMRK